MKTEIIKCPYCGAEYLPEEIFMGDEFLGNREIVKDENGKITIVGGIEPELSSSYVCDCCNKRFIVKATVTYEVMKDDFEEEYTVKIQ